MLLKMSQNFKSRSRELLILTSILNSSQLVNDFKQVKIGYEELYKKSEDSLAAKYDSTPFDFFSVKEMLLNEISQANWPVEKSAIGEFLYPRVTKIAGVELAGWVTGMLMKLDELYLLKLIGPRPRPRLMKRL